MTCCKRFLSAAPAIASELLPPASASGQSVPLATIPTRSRSTSKMGSRVAAPSPAVGHGVGPAKGRVGVAAFDDERAAGGGGERGGVKPVGTADAGDGDTEVPN